MTDNKDKDGAQQPETTAEQPVGEDGRAPERVIGTPTPGQRLPVIESEAEPAPDAAGAELDEDSARRAERVVATFFLIAFAASVAFIAAYVWSGSNPGGMHGIDETLRSNYALGTAMTVSFLAMAAGVTIWVRRLMTSQQIVQQRGELVSSAEDRAVFAANFQQGADEAAITKRPLLRRTLLLAAAPLGLAPLVLLRDLGPLPEKKLRHTYWGEAVKKAKSEGKKGVRLVIDGTNRPLKASDFNSVGGIITVLPEGIEHEHEVLNKIAKASTLLVHVPVEKLKPAKGRENWHVGGIIAYSKICTHVGCPAALYEQTTHHILCPCHQSTFDATDGAKVIFGPAARALPQLPIGVDNEGYLIATDDFPVPIGPSFWERGDVKS